LHRAEKVRRALLRLRTGKFLGIKRLRAYPSAMFLISCRFPTPRTSWSKMTFIRIGRLTTYCAMSCCRTVRAFQAGHQELALFPRFNWLDFDIRLQPAISRIFPLGRTQCAIVSLSNDPSLRLKVFCTVPFPKLVSPISFTFRLSRKVPARISAAEAEPPLIKTTIGRFASASLPPAR